MKIVVDHVWAWIEGAHPSHIILPVLSYLDEGRFFNPAFKAGYSDGRIKYIQYDRSRKQYKFPAGLLSRVTKALDEANFQYELSDDRIYEMPEPKLVLFDNHGKHTIDLRKGKWSFQSDIVTSALSHGRGIIHMPTGGGKTEVGASLIASIWKPTVWLTHRTNLMYQTHDRLAKRLQVPIGMVGDGNWDIQFITVVMIQTAVTSLKEGREDLDNFLRACEVIVGDEAHHAEADSWLDSFGKIQAPWRFGLTATPHLTGPGLALIGMTGDVIASISLLELIERRVLVVPRIWFYPINAPKLNSKVDSRSAYKQAIVENLERNEAICSIADVFRMENKPCITLVKRVAHGEMLCDMMNMKGIRSEYIRGSTSKAERELIFQMLQEGRFANVVATAEIVGEGTDLPWLRALINATGARGGGDKTEGESGRGTLQFLGRILRHSEGKYYADYVDIADRTHKSLKDASLARVKTLQSEGYTPFIKYWSHYKVHG